MYQHPDQRPRFLNLWQFRFPLNAKLSAMHRITGVLLLISLACFLALAHLIILNPQLDFYSIQAHWISQTLFKSFWILISFHWLTGLRHLLAEHFLQPELYQKINSRPVSFALLASWLVIAVLILLN